MLGAPALCARDLLGTAEIVAVLGVGQPPALTTGSLARLSVRLERDERRTLFDVACPRKVTNCDPKRMMMTRGVHGD